MTLAKFNPSAMQSSVQCLTPWLTWFGAVENKPSQASRTKVHIQGEAGIPDDQWECGYNQSKLHERSPLEVASHPTLVG
jgi:hypothetical protein